MPVTFPTKFDVREARDQASKAVAGAMDPWRGPSLAALGLGDVAMATARDVASRVQSGATDVQARVEELPHELRELRSHLSAQEFRRLAERYTAALRSAYTDLIARGESAYAHITAQPQVKQTLTAVERVSGEVEDRVEDAVEEFRVRGENTLGWFTTQTRSVGERTARTTQRVSGRVAQTVTAVGGELADDIGEAGDEAASRARSVARKTAAGTAPNKQGPKNAPRSAATGRTGASTARARS